MVGLVLVPRRLFEYPWAMSAVFAAFVAPQLLSLLNRPDRIPPGSYAPLVGMAILCMLACWLGYAKKPSPGVARGCTVRLNDDRLLHGGLALLAIGIVSTFLMAGAAELAENRTQHGIFTGASTMWHFFGQLQPLGFGIVLMSALRRPDTVTIGAVVAGLWSPLVAAVFFGRREPTVLTALIIMLSLFFRKGVSPPRWVVLFGILAAGFLIPITSEYRMYAKDDGLMALTRFDPIQTLSDAYWNGKAGELSYAAHVIAATRETGEYGYGRGYWNTMVFRFVPAQIVGQDTKEGLMLANPSTTQLVLPRRSGVTVGTTQTGLADSFSEFGYFGCLFFALVAVLFRNLWEAATRYRSTSAQLLYMVMLSSSMRAITHQTWDFLPALVYNGLFLGVVFLYAREPAREQI
jgi:hypothetical protein